MNIVTLYENNDLAMRKSLDRYLSQLSKNGAVHVWNDEMVLPGERPDDILQEQLKNADLVLLLVSQDFLASKICYERALKALEMHAKNPKKKIVNILLRPNSLEDTPFKELPQLPAQNVCITQYRDSEQGYWDVYQGLKKIINPQHRYKKRPKIAALQATMLGSAVLLLWSLFVLLLPIIYPQEGLRIMAKPVLDERGRGMYFKIYKLDHADQKDVVLAFKISPSDTAKYGQLLPFSGLKKMDNTKWEKNQTFKVGPHSTLISNKNEYFAQCVLANFNENDEGEYCFSVVFSKPLNKNMLADFNKKLSWGHESCSTPESNSENINYFSPLHYLYLQSIRFYTSILVFLLITLLFTTFYYLKKTSFYAHSKRQSYN